MKRLFSFWSMLPWRITVRRFSKEEPMRHWYPTRFFVLKETDSNFALLILNSSADFFDRRHVTQLWPKATLRACADGGANQLASLNSDQGTAFYPDFICGDLDSIRKENIDYFKEHGSAIYENTSVESTDFTKSTRLLAQRIKENQTSKIDTIVTVGGLLGRFDHVMGCVNTLFLLQQDYPKLAIYCVQHCSMITLLPPGRHTIHVDEGVSTGICGLAPIGCPAEKVTTAGLEWNLDNQRLAFGTLVSTSNCVKAPEVRVTTDAPLLWILNLKNG